MSTTRKVIICFREHPDWTSGAIAEHVGCTSACVRAALTRNGFKLARKHGGQRKHIIAPPRALIKAAGCT